MYRTAVAVGRVADGATGKVSPVDNVKEDGTCSEDDLMRAAVIGGGAYVVGSKVAQSEQHTAQQDAQLAAAQQQQQQAAPAAPAASQDDKMAQLKQLKDLLDSGVLTQAEFDAQKQKILQSM